MRLHDKFEWDDAKARANLRKHGLAFDTAAFALADPEGDFYHHEQLDEAHSAAEDRYCTIASHPGDRSLVFTMVWTEREDGADLVTRLISARFATFKERKQYAEYIRQKNRA